MEINLATVNESGEHEVSAEAVAQLRQAFRLDQQAAATAEQRRLFSGLEDARLLGIPVWPAIGGGTVALLTSEVISGWIGPERHLERGVVKLLTGAAIIGFLGRLVGTGLSNAAGMFLTFDAVRDMVPLDRFVRDLLHTVTPSQPRTPPRAPEPFNGDLMDQQLDELLRSM